MLGIIAPFIILGLLLAQLFAHQLTIISLDETVAKALGQRTFAMTMTFLAFVVILSAAAVALVGSIAFVGLIIPHFIKRLSDYPSFNSICWEHFYALGRFVLPYNQSASRNAS